MQLPQQPLAMTHSEHGLLIRLPGQLPRFEIICETLQAENLWSELQKSLKPVGRSGWEWLEIQAGIPDIVPGTQDSVLLKVLDGQPTGTQVIHSEVPA